MDLTLPIEKSSSRTEKWIFNHFNETGHIYDITSEFNSHKLIIHPIEPELPPLKSEFNKLIKLSNYDNLAKTKANASTSRLKKMCLEAGSSMNYTQSRDSGMCTSKSYVLCTSAPKLMTPFPNNNFQHITFEKHKLDILSHNTTNKSDKATLCCRSIDTDLHLKVSIKSSNSFPNLGYYQMQGSSKLMPDINQFIPPNPISILPFWPINTTYKGLDANKHYHQSKQASIPSKNIKSNSHGLNKQVVSMQHYSMPLDNYQSYGMKSHLEPSLMSHPSIAYWCWVRQAQIQAQMQLQMQMLSHPFNSLNPYNLKGAPIPPQPIVPPFSLLQKHLFNPKNYNCDVTWCVLNNIQPSSLPLTTETMGENKVMRENVCDEMNEAKASDDMGRQYSSSYAYWNPKRKSFAPINVLNQRKEKSSLSNTKHKLKKTDFHTPKHSATTKHSNKADESIEEEEEEMEEDVHPKVRPRANTNDISLNQAEIRSSLWEETAGSSCKRIASASTLIPAPPSPSHTPERSFSPPENQHKFSSSNHLKFPAQSTIACTQDDKNLVFGMEEQMKQGVRDDIDPFSRESEHPHLPFPSPFYYQYPFLQHQPSYAPSPYSSQPKDVNGVAAAASAYESWYQALRHQYAAAVMASSAYTGNYSSNSANMRSQTPNKDVSTSPLITEQNSPVLAPSSILPPPPYFASPSFANANLPPYVAASNGALEQQQQFYAAAAYYYQAAYAAAQANHEKSARASYFDDAFTLRSRERTFEMPPSPKPRAAKIDDITAKTPETVAIVVAAAESTTSSPAAGPGALKANDDPVSSPHSVPEALTTTVTTTGCGGVDQIKKTSFKIWRQFGQSTSATTPSTALSVSTTACTSAGVDKNFVKQQFNLNHILENLKSQQAASSVPYPLGQSPYHGNNHHASTASILAAARNEKFVCPTCSKVFQKQSQLSLHINVHFFERPFRCEACNQRFRIKGLLTKHKCPSKGALTTRSGSNVEASFCAAAAGSSLDSCTFADLSSAFDLSTSFYLSASAASKTNPTSSPYPDPSSTANGQPGGGSTPTNDPRPFKCDDCQVAFRIQGHLAKHLRSKMHITGLEKNGKVPCGTYAFFDQRASLNDIDTTSCSASLGSLHRLLQQNNCLEGTDLSATTANATSLALSVNGHTERGQEISSLASASAQPESVKTTLQVSSKKRPLVVESGGSEEHSNASSAPDALSENPVSISQTHNLEILCSATKYRKKINV